MTSKNEYGYKLLVIITVDNWIRQWFQNADSANNQDQSLTNSKIKFVFTEYLKAVAQEFFVEQRIKFKKNRALIYCIAN